MFPVIDIGPIAIQSAGLILLLGFFFGTWLTTYFAKNLGTNGTVIENSLLYGLISGILGARIGFVLQNPNIFVGNIWSFFSPTPTMLSGGFGLLVGSIVAIIIAQKNHLPLLPTLDTLSPFVLMMFTSIHLANLAEGNAFGLSTNLPWGIELWGTVRHPVQLYAVFISVIILCWILGKTNFLHTTGFLKSGILINLTLALLSMTTIFIRAFIDRKILLGPIDVWQLGGLIVLIINILLIYKQSFQTQKPISVFFSMGSNLKAEINLENARNRLSESFKIRRASSIYRTEPVKDGNQKTYYLNQILELETAYSFSELREHLKEIEKEFGRDTGNRKQIPLDLDILSYHTEVFIFNGKNIPDPDIVKYRYIAEPLAEIAPNFRHPGTGVSIESILKSIEDTAKVEKIKESDNGPEK